MRKYAALLSAALSLALLCACGQGAATPTPGVRPTPAAASTPAPTPTPTAAPLETADIRFSRQDHSIRNADGSLSMELYFDLATVAGEGPAVEKLNDNLRALYDDYLEILEDMDPEAEAEQKIYPDETYLYTYTGAASYNQDGVLSVLYGVEWYMGGVYNWDPDALVLDLATGERVSPEALFDYDPEKLLALIQERVGWYVQQNTMEGLNEWARETIQGYTLDTLSYYISEDGELMVYAPTYVLGTGADGAMIVPCGIYLHGAGDPAAEPALPQEYIGRSFGELKAGWDGAYVLDALSGSSCVYFQDSPLFFFGVYLEEIDDTQMIRSLIAYGDQAVSPELSGGMTLPALAQALGDEVALGEPEYFENLIEDRMEYSLSFDHDGFRYSYLWLNDPQSTPSEHVAVGRTDIPMTP